MLFEWNDEKRLNNLEKHGIDFAEVDVVFNNDLVSFLDTRFDYGEERFITIGLLKARLVTVVHTESDNTIRIISARKATKNEQTIYFSQLFD